MLGLRIWLGGCGLRLGLGLLERREESGLFVFFLFCEVLWLFLCQRFVYFWGFSEAFVCRLSIRQLFCYDFSGYGSRGCVVTTSEGWNLVTH
jgi:hypothetical protein